jgi:hypothetical protein
MAKLKEEKKAKAPAPLTEGPVVIFLTDKRELGRPIRLVPHPRFKQRTTQMAHRAARFATEKEARKFLRKLERLGRYCYTVSTL